MKRFAVLACLVAGLAVALASKANDAARGNGDDDLSEPELTAPIEKVDEAHAAYAARVAEYERAARLTHVVEEPPCPEGSMLWQRDSVTALCAPLCTGDVDCIEGVERCAALSIPGVIEDEEFARERQALGADADQVEGSRGRRDFVDDDRDAARRVREGKALGLCDPFFDFEGATDASLVEVDDGRALAVDAVESGGDDRRRKADAGR